MHFHAKLHGDRWFVSSLRCKILQIWPNFELEGPRIHLPDWSGPNMARENGPLVCYFTPNLGLIGIYVASKWRRKPQISPNFEFWKLLWSLPFINQGQVWHARVNPWCILFQALCCPWVTSTRKFDRIFKFNIRRWHHLATQRQNSTWVGITHKRWWFRKSLAREAPPGAVDSSTLNFILITATCYPCGAETPKSTCH